MQHTKKVVLILLRMAFNNIIASNSSTFIKDLFRSGIDTG